MEFYVEPYKTLYGIMVYSVDSLPLIELTVQFLPILYSDQVTSTILFYAIKFDAFIWVLLVFNVFIFCQKRWHS